MSDRTEAREGAAGAATVVFHDACPDRGSDTLSVIRTSCAGNRAGVTTYDRERGDGTGCGGRRSRTRIASENLSTERAVASRSRRRTQ